MLKTVSSLSLSFLEANLGGDFPYQEPPKVEKTVFIYGNVANAINSVKSFTGVS